MRSFLRQSFSNHLATAYEHANAQKRGGNAKIIAIESEEGEHIVASLPEDASEAFDREWRFVIFERAFERLRKEFDDGARTSSFAAISAFFLAAGEAPSYQDLARAHAMSVPQLKSALHRSRTRLRELVDLEIADTVAAHDDALFESRALSQLAHPNIVSIFDAGEDDGVPYLVMEFIDGETLAAKCPLEPVAAIDTLIAVCDAVAHAHAARVAHRDLKPENVLIRNDGAIKVTDFGLARPIDARGWTLTGRDQTVGTPFHIAPEVLRGEPALESSDLYALGVMLYRVVMNKMPVGNFEAAPGALDAICRTAMSENPALRYASASAMRDALVAARAHFGVNASELSAADQQWLRAVALLHAAATAVTGYAILTSIIPKTISSQDLGALIISQPLSPGRNEAVSLARFEVWPTLGAMTVIAIALLAQGFLRRHWAQNSLDRKAPDSPLHESKVLFGIGVVCMFVMAIRDFVPETSAFSIIGRYSTFYGGLLEVLAMYVFCHGVLEAIRRARSLRREPLFWIGTALTLLPPTFALLSYARPWLDIR